MKIVKPSAQILGLSAQALFAIEAAGRISHGSESQQTIDSWKRFISNVIIDHGDWSVVEHVNASVLFKVDRGITHEIVRHRLFAYTQSSTRFINYAKKKDGIVTRPAEFIYPKADEHCTYCETNEAMRFPDGWFHIYEDKPQIGCRNSRVWMNAIYDAERYYKEFIETGWPPQLARSVLPNSLASTLLMTGNLRNWRHFFLMRTSVESHPQMREVTIPLLAEFKEKVPLLYDDISPGARQIDNLKKAR